jgi:hypothetical protein
MWQEQTAPKGPEEAPEALAPRQNAAGTVAIVVSNGVEPPTRFSSIEN